MINITMNLNVYIGGCHALKVIQENQKQMQMQKQKQMQMQMRCVKGLRL